jgi:hypothetical protein
MQYQAYVEMNPKSNWQNLRLRCKGRWFLLAWDGTRLARSSELSALVARAPEVAESFAAWLEQRPG